VKNHCHFWPVTLISYALRGGVARSMKPRKPITNSTTDTITGIAVQVTSRTVLWLREGRTVSSGPRRRYRSTNQTMSPTMTAKKNTEIQ